MELRQSYSVPFPLGRTYAAWVSSDTVIPPATGMDIDPVVGGHYRLIMESPDFVSRNEGRFLVVEPERRLRYTWEWNGDGEVSEIDVRFSEVPEGTRVSIVHRGFLTAESRENHSRGWDSYVEGFIAFLKDRA